MTEVGHPRRWFILGILNLSLILVVASVSSLNLSLPSIQQALDASAADLIWINAAYALVFAAFLLPAGALGDRFGRKGALLTGLVVFVCGSLLATTADTAVQVIAFRALMGTGAALAMPATLSILTAVFPPDERDRAIAVWAGFAGAGGAIGILAAGVLLEYFWWGSVFFVNVPIAITALVLVVAFVPTSRDTQGHNLDPVGSLLSAVGLAALVFGLIQGPEYGWTDPVVLGAFAASIMLLTSWVAVERRQEHPMLDPALFRIPRFALATLALGTAFAVMFGMFFGLAQYLQFVLGYSPLGAAVRIMPFAFAMIAIAPRGPALAARFGSGRVIGGGMLVTALGCVVMALLTGDSGYGHVILGVLLVSSGMALGFPTSTAAIVGSLPLDKAGVASAVNDTTREVGAAVGIALLGSLLSAGYRRGLGDALDQAPAEMADIARDSVGAALVVAQRAPAGVGGHIAATARGAFANGYSLSMTAGAALLAVAATVVIMRWPAD
ncbi:MAG: MFS transporter [Actinobacteria bacterium]|nr:MFS transporter [Actinomycetota bacterium]